MSKKKKKKKGIRAAFKKIFSARKWNEVRTRKKMLFFAIFLALTYTTVSYALLTNGKELDSTLTEEFFTFAKWLVGSGVAITLTDKAADTIKYFKEHSTDEESDGESYEE